MYKDTRRNCIKLSVVIIVAVSLFGGLFAIGYLLYREPYDLADLRADYLARNLSTNYSAQPSSWLQSECNNPSRQCTTDGYSGVHPLVIISLDGFAASHLKRNITPVLHKLMACGSHSQTLQPGFPSISFPNHYSIATGLHSESHGIVDNKFFDPDLRRSFNYKEGDAGPNADPVWWKGEPLWVTAKKQGKKVITYYWPGNEVLIRGYRADEWRQYNHEDTFDDRLQRVLDRLLRPQETRPDLIMLYYDEPDAKGHIYGVDAPEVSAAVKEVDASIGRFLQGLHEKNLTECVNLIILSDHGMENAYCNQSVDLMSILNDTQRNGQQHTASRNFITDEDFVLRGHTEGGIDSRSSNVSLDVLYNSLSCRQAPLPNSTDTAVPFLLYKKEDLPRRFHYTNSRRIEPLILNVKAGFTVFQTADPTNFCFGGRHGYDPMLQTMDSIFIVHGPAFKTGVELESLANTELYNLFCELVQIVPAPNNGTEGALHRILRHPKTLLEPVALAVVWPQNLSRYAIVQRQNNHCLQTCSEITGRVIGADMRLIQSDQEQKKSSEQHALPYGLPEASQNASVIVLVNSIFALGYSRRNKLPMWASLYVNSSSLAAANYFDLNVTCARDDIRLNVNTTFSCNDFELDSYSTETVPTYLVSPGFGKTRTHRTEATIITNVVPMYQGFRSGVWKRFWQMIGRWSNATGGGQFHVQVGPVFDHNAPYGLPDDEYRMVEHMVHNDIPMPSHFFTVISRRLNSSSMSSSVDAIGFILPHRTKKLHDCQSDEEYFLDHSALVKDVELVTGLRLFTGLPVDDRLKLRIRPHRKLWL